MAREQSSAFVASGFVPDKRVLAEGSGQGDREEPAATDCDGIPERQDDLTSSLGKLGGDGLAVQRDGGGSDGNLRPKAERSDLERSESHGNGFRLLAAMDFLGERPPSVAGEERGAEILG